MLSISFNQTNKAFSTRLSFSGNEIPKKSGVSQMEIAQAREILMPSLYNSQLHSENMDWALAVNKGINFALDGLNTGKISTSSEILNTMIKTTRQELRKNYFPSLKAIDKSDKVSVLKEYYLNEFGVERVGSSQRWTPLIGDFSIFKPLAISTLITNGKQTVNETKQQSYEYVLKYNFNNKKIVLSSLESDWFPKNEDPEERIPFNSADIISSKVDATPLVKEALNEQLQNIINLKQDIKSGKVMKDNSTLSTMMDKISEAHWLISQGWPYKRGSAAIADMYTKVIERYMGIGVSEWKENVNPNIMALITPLEDYKMNYISMFKEPPKWALHALA